MLLQLKNKSIFIRACRLTIAVILGIILAKMLDLEISGWILITISVIMFDQGTVGGTIQKGYYRLMATLIGSIIGITTLFIFKNTAWVNDIVIIITAFIAATLFTNRKDSYIGNLCFITVVIILMDVHSIHEALLRPINILIGVFLSLILSRYFLPQYAKNSLLTLLEQCGNNLIKLIDDLLIFDNIENKQEKFRAIEINLMQNIIDFSKIKNEALFERKSDKPLIVSYSNIFLHYRRIYRLLSSLYYTQLQPDFILDTITQDKLSIIKAQLNIAIDAINTKKTPIFMEVAKIEIDKQKSVATIASETIINHIIIEISNITF